MSDFNRMTRDEIEHRYQEQYVVVVEPEWLDPSSDDFTSARVVTVGQEWQETIDRARPLLTHGDQWVCGFTGDRQIVFQWVAALTFFCVSGYPLVDECRKLDHRTGPRISQKTMNVRERLTWEQIRERYPDRWVVMADHDLQEGDPTTYTTARVLAHGATRGEAMGRARKALQAYDFYGCRYTGTIRGPLSQLRALEIVP